jgi:4'-phosphopantetheinyl transferase
MPLEKIEHKADFSWGLWKITEPETVLQSRLLKVDSIPENVTHPNKRLEFLSARVLAKTLLEQRGFTYSGINKNEAGKPYFNNHTLQLSLSHSFPYVAALLHTTHAAGIDVEQPKAKLLKIAPRILNPVELDDAGNDETKLCVYWCAKESLIKVYGKKDLVFATEMSIDSFRLETCGTITGHILKNETNMTIPLTYQIFEGFVMVHSM